MNYLAHLFLSDHSPEGFVGSLLGDFVKGNLDGSYPSKIAFEIVLHRKVDSFTDTHDVFRKSKHRISEKRRRFAGIMVDVFYDHFLAKNWTEFSNVPLDAFSQTVYEALKTHQAILPEVLQNRLSAIIENNLLVSYKTLEGIDLALRRLSRRLKRENPLGEGVQELKKNYAEFESDFITFFPELIAYVGELRKQQWFYGASNQHTLDQSDTR